METLELGELTTEKERLEGDRKTLLERLQQYQQAATQAQTQLTAIGGAIQTVDFFIGKLQPPEETTEEETEEDSGLIT